ncbi:unnamed protein product, partial [Mesorhabditis spiculigera]
MYLTSLFEDPNDEPVEREDDEPLECFEGWLLVTDTGPTPGMARNGGNDFPRWQRGYCVGRADDYSLICYKNEQLAHTIARDVPRTRLDGGVNKFIKYWKSQETRPDYQQASNIGTVSRAQRMFSTLSRMTSLKEEDRLMTDYAPELSRKFSISTMRISRKKSVYTPKIETGKLGLHFDTTCSKPELEPYDFRIPIRYPDAEAKEKLSCDHLESAMVVDVEADQDFYPQKFPEFTYHEENRQLGTPRSKTIQKGLSRSNFFTSALSVQVDATSETVKLIVV